MDTLVARSFVISILLFVLGGAMESRIIGLLAILLIIPLTIAILGAFLFQIYCFRSETRKPRKRD